MNPPTIITQYKETHRDSEFLGRIVWFSVREQSIPHAQIASELRQVGLDKYTPTMPADSDVFRRVSTAAQKKRLDGPDGVRLNVLVRQVDDTPASILRRIVVEEVDQKGRRLDYTEAYDVSFDRTHGGISIAKITDRDFAGVDDDTAVEIRQMYLAQRGCVDANAIRTTIKKVLDDAEAVLVRDTGGVNFAPRHTVDLVDRLERFSAQIPGTEVHSLPLIDTQKQRGLVQNGVEAAVNKEVDELLTEVRDLKNGQVKPSKAAQLLNRSKELRRRLDNMKELLEDNLETAESRLELLAFAVRDLVKAAA